MKDAAVKRSSKSRLLKYFEKYMLVIGVFGQLLFFTQGFKIFITHSANDVSMTGFVIGLISVSSWLIYGILIRNRVLIVANVVAVIGALFVILGILIHGG